MGKRKRKAATRRLFSDTQNHVHDNFRKKIKDNGKHD